MIDLTKYEPLFYKLARKYAFQGNDIEDLLQICRLEALEVYKRYDPSKCTFMTYLYASLETRLRRAHNNTKGLIQYSEYIIRAVRDGKTVDLPCVDNRSLDYYARKFDDSTFENILEFSEPDFTEKLDSLIDASEFLSGLDCQKIVDEFKQRGPNRHLINNFFKKLELTNTRGK